MTKYYAVVTHKIVEVAPARSREVGTRIEWNDGESFMSFDEQVSGIWPLNFEKLNGLPGELREPES